ncbi:MAG TPA: IclR family transcriptional regulator [Gemmatimonadaceae bacterium]|nr:IclR family transcriptional regulator [Gemmatimonadaceae bacterium]
MNRRSKTDAPPRGTGTQAVARALAVLRALERPPLERGLTELAAGLAMSKATVFRLLRTLELEGFVTRDPERQTYRLGPSLIRLGGVARRATTLQVAARPVLERLAAASGETATLETLAGDEVLILDEVRGRYLVSTAPEIGTRWPAHATSTGKVLLAARETGGASRTADQPGADAPPLPRLAPRTITVPADLARELAEVRRRGYAVAREELEPGFVAIGAPVTDASGRVVAAISVGGPIARLDDGHIEPLATAVRDAAAEVSRQLGAPPDG